MKLNREACDRDEHKLISAYIPFERCPPGQGKVLRSLSGDTVARALTTDDAGDHRFSRARCR
jgi:hypothetical protein